MASATKSVSAADKKSGAFRNYEEWFTQSPDPWEEIAALEPGADRTFASTAQRMITAAEPAQRPAMETKLLGVLAQPTLTEHGRMFVCRMLGLIGTERSVPALAPLLGDARTADAARYALEAIPGEAAAAALRNALTNLRGDARVGLIGALALRGDMLAATEMKTIARNPTEPADVREAAARAAARLTPAT